MNATAKSGSSPDEHPAMIEIVPVGATVDLVNATRLPARPLEQLPLARDRYSLGARYMHRFRTATLRLEERLYLDSWQ